MSEIVSFNLSWATQKNVIAGSEWFFVLNCHKNIGKELKESGLSACTEKGAEGILKNTNFDIMGAQECLVDLSPKIVDYLNTNRSRGKGGKGGKSDIYDYILTSYKKSSIMTVYKKNLAHKKPIIMKKGNLGGVNDMRPFHVIYFPKIKLLFANGHFPHNLSISDYDDFFKKMFIFDIGSRKVDRIIFTGDFNDNLGYLAKRGFINIELTNGQKFKLTCNNLKNVQTCCFVFFNFTGDYVWDSEETNKLNIVPNFVNSFKNVVKNKNKFIGSDHLPVVSKSKKKL